MSRKSVFAGSAWSLIVGAGLWAGCSSGPEAGTSGGPCLANNACNAGLACTNNVCGPSMDSGVDDSGIVDSGKKDTGKLDTGVMDTSMGGCPTPSDVTNFMPPAVHDPVTPSNVCTSNETALYYTDCISMYDQTKCDAFVMAKAACAACLETFDDKTANWGAVVDRTFFHFELNMSGCVKLLGDSPCQAAIQAEYQCEKAACMAECWDTSPMMGPDVMALTTCFTNAAKGGCKKYADAITTTCNAADGGSAFGQCKALAPSFATGFTNFAGLFCQAGSPDGGPPSDAGPADASDGG